MTSGRETASQTRVRLEGVWDQLPAGFEEEGDGEVEGVRTVEEVMLINFGDVGVGEGNSFGWPRVETMMA